MTNGGGPMTDDRLVPRPRHPASAKFDILTSRITQKSTDFAQTDGITVTNWIVSGKIRKLT